MKLVHVLFGPETYLIHQKKEEIIKNTLSEDEIDLNVSVHDARESSIQEAIDDCQMVSFLGGKRVVVVKDCYFLTTEKAKEKIDHDLDRLASYIESPNDDTVLILMVPYEKMDNRKKVVKTMKKHSSMYEGKQLKGGQLFDWICRSADGEGIVISNDAANMLITYIGSNLTQLEQELKKMALYIGKGNELLKEQVEILVSKTIEQDIFKLINSVMSKDLKQTFEILEDMFRQGEDSIKIINLIARQFRIIFQIKQLQNQGLNEGQIASRTKQHPYTIKMSMHLIGNYESKQLLEMLAILSDLDYKMKTGQLPKDIALESFITKIA